MTPPTPPSGRLLPPPGRLGDDPFLAPWAADMRSRRQQAAQLADRMRAGHPRLADAAAGHEYFGLHCDPNGWVFREWAPAATAMHLVGAFNDWRPQPAWAATRVAAEGVWELRLPAHRLQHGDLYRLHLAWPGGEGDRIPAYARRVVQDPHTHIANAQVWAPPEPYAWRHDIPARRPGDLLLIYETHVGMAQERAGIGSYEEFRTQMVPRIAGAGYNTIQLMAVMEHPYYASFGYQVSSFFAASSRFGTPCELKALIDTAHAHGLRVVMDLIHSHAVRNEVEGISRFDGTLYQFFHAGPRGDHPAWDSRCFDYGKPAVLHFLLSNCRFWLDEYRFDGFRFDGVTSMLYHHHGLSGGFNRYDDYFGAAVDPDAIAYLTLANAVIHEVRPDAITIAEDVSGMPGLAAPVEEGGCGFDARLAMGVPDCWFKLVNDTRDEAWDIGWLWHELTNRRGEERTISYAECHDQALVGGKTLMFELADAHMYDAMHADSRNLAIDRAMALHKMIRLATLATCDAGYLNFMGNEFGHPEWVDFPREGNGWSYHHARRQWSLLADEGLRYRFLAAFDRAMLALLTAPVADRKRSSPSGPVRLPSPAAQTLAIRRGRLVFLFNFHHEHSLVDHPFEVAPGSYRLALDTDTHDVGGHNRIAAGQIWHSQPVQVGNELRHLIRVYLPCRTALVVEHQAGAQAPAARRRTARTKARGSGKTPPATA